MKTSQAKAQKTSGAFRTDGAIRATADLRRAVEGRTS
jgi:hypothetical protein